MLRFYARRRGVRRVVTVLLCSRLGVFSADRGVAIPADVGGLLWQDAVLSQAAKPRVATPGVIGLGLKRAERVVANARSYLPDRKLGVAFGGEWVERDAAPGTVLLQAPWRGEMEMSLAVQVVVAMPPSPPCRARQLQLTFTGFPPQPPGTTEGGDFAIRNVGRRFCRLTGPLTIVGTDAAGQADTRVATLPVPPALVLSPNTTLVPRGSFMPAMPVYATFDFTSPDPAHCPGPLVDPAGWNVQVAHGTLTVPNISGQTTGVTSLGVCPTAISPRPIAAG